MIQNFLFQLDYYFRNVIYATAFLRKIGQEASRRRSSLQIDDTSLIDGFPHVNNGIIHDPSSKNASIVFGGNGKFKI